MPKTPASTLGLREYFDQSLDLYCQVDREGIFLHVNPAWEDRLGYRRDEIVGRNFQEFVHPKDLTETLDVFNGHQSFSGRFVRNRYRHKNGHYITLLWSGHTDQNGQVSHGHGRDVTDEVRKASLLESVASIQDSYMHSGADKRGLFEQVLQEILKATESAYGFIGEIRDTNPPTDKFLSVYSITPGFERYDLVSMSERSIKIGHPVFINTASETFMGVPLHYLGEHIGMIGVANRSGGYDEKFLEQLKPVLEATASVVGLFHASQRENALRERFLAIVENLPIMLTEFGGDGRIMWANKFFRDRLGWTETEIAKQDLLLEIVGGASEEERARKFMLSGRTDWEDFNLRHKSGHFFQSTWTNIRMKDGRAIGIGQDITDRRAAEAKMVQSSKMASLGEMSAGVSHEINNPLAIIQGSAFRAIQNLNNAIKRDEVEGDLNRIIQNCDRIARIVRGLRAFSRSVDHEPFIPTPIAMVIEDVLNLAHERFKSQNIELHVPSDDRTVVDCRPVQLGQVLMNLLNNAYDAISEQTKGPRAVWVQTQIAGDHIQISVEDTGLGIPSAVQHRILEPFFTTKEVGKGTGLGLSISKGIVESHNGRLWLDTDSKRTRFVIELPIRQKDEP